MKNVKTFDNIRFNNFDNGGMDKSVVKGQFPTGCADPYIMRYNGMFYLYVTTSGLTNYGLRAWKSFDLLNWDPCQGKGLKPGYVIKDVDDEGRYTQNAYAPEVYYFNGKFYMIISPGPQAVSEFRGHRILISDNPEGPFEAYSEQIDKRIDGTLLIDDDESIYFAHATPFGITIHEFNNMKELGEGALIKASDGTGAWTEGPGFTKARGYYYLTYTGCHYQTPGYQVIYAVSDKLDKTNIQTIADSFKRGASRVVLLNCDKDEGHVGLGHSINFMGPDLDSYYICYHNLDNLYPDGMTHRSFNIDRLLIKDGLMTSVQNLKGTIYPNWPFFESRGLINFEKYKDKYISKESSKNRFTAEYNSLGGKETKYIFSYLDDNNYCYVLPEYEKHLIKCVQIENGKQRLLGKGELKYLYSNQDNQTIRVAYDGVLNIYFNNLLKITAKVQLNKGKIGYQFLEDNYEVGYSAISDEANGSSDNNEIKQALGETSANLYLKDDASDYLLHGDNIKELKQYHSEYSYSKGLRYNYVGEYTSYLLNFKQRGHYGIALTLPKEYLGEQLSLTLDDKERIVTLNEAFDSNEDIVRIFVDYGEIEQGVHKLKIKNLAKELVLISFLFAPFKNEFKYKGQLNKVTEGYHQEKDELLVEGRRDFAYLSNQLLTDMEIEADIELDDVTEEKGSIGLMVRQNNYAYSDVPHQDFKDANTHIQGYYLEIKKNMVRLNRYNFGDVKSYELIHKDFTNLLGEMHHYKLKIQKNVLEVYMDGSILFKVADPIAFATGALAIYSYRCKGIYKNIKAQSI